MTLSIRAWARSSSVLIEFRLQRSGELGAVFAFGEEEENLTGIDGGATHHGFKADASEVGGELENFINEIRRAHSKNSVD